MFDFTTKEDDKKLMPLTESGPAEQEMQAM
jgi:hypothetical protein